MAENPDEILRDLEREDEKIVGMREEDSEDRG